MHLLLLYIVSISITVAQNLFENQDSTEVIDKFGTGSKTGNIDGSNPVSIPATLNLLADDSETPKLFSNSAENYNNDPGYSSDTPTFLAYNSDILHDFGKSPSAPETHSDNPFLNSDTPSSASPEANPIAVPDFNPSDPVQLGSLASAAPGDKTSDMDPGSDDEPMPDGNDDLSDLSGVCTTNLGATGLEKRDASSCPVVVIRYHTSTGKRERGLVTDDQLKQDWNWIQQRYRENKKPMVAQNIKGKCDRLAALFSLPRLIPMCCLGPSRIFARELVNSYMYYISDEENCGFNFVARPICRKYRNKFCCQKVGDRMRTQVDGQTQLFWGENCVPMWGLPKDL